MKKTIIFAAIACVALASCVKNERIVSSPTKGETEIAFSAITNPNTKAVVGEMPVAYNTAEQFIAYAAWTPSDYDATGTISEFFVNNFTTAICSHDATLNAWTPAEKYYWPKTGKLTFEAVSPADARYRSTITHDWADGFTFTDFEVCDGVADQFDLLYSDREYNKVRTLYTGDPYDEASDDDTDPNHIYNGVDLMFRHALSSIVFKVRTDKDYTADEVEIILTGLTIDNADKKGTFTENVDDSVAPSWSAAPQWDKTYDAADEYTYDVFSGSQTVEYNSGTAAQVTPKISGSSNAILLPQDLAHGTGCNDVTVTVNYTISQHGSAAMPQTSVVTLKELEASGTPITAWQMGKRYIYTIVFKLDEIYFDPKVDTWTDVNMDPYILPY